LARRKQLAGHSKKEQFISNKIQNLSGQVKIVGKRWTLRHEGIISFYLSTTAISSHVFTEKLCSKWNKYLSNGQKSEFILNTQTRR
jgi:hypothetical protein